MLKLYSREEEKLSGKFGEIWHKVPKTHTGGPETPLERFNQNQIFCVVRPHAIETICKSRKKVIRQFLRNRPFCLKILDLG